HLIREHRPSRQCPALPVSYFYAQISRDAINRQKSDVVRRKLIFDSGIAETYDQFHALNSSCRDSRLGCPAERGSAFPRTSYFFSFFSAFSGAASPSSSVSCLPFLMTSGSVGAPASAATASGAASTISFTEVTWATGWFSSVMNFSLSECGRSWTRKTLPNVNW